jgi:hypothetical protein
MASIDDRSRRQRTDRQLMAGANQAFYERVGGPRNHNMKPGHCKDYRTDPMFLLHFRDASGRASSGLSC